MMIVLGLLIFAIIILSHILVFRIKVNYIAERIAEEIYKKMNQ